MRLTLLLGTTTRKSDALTQHSAQNISWYQDNSSKCEKLAKKKLYSATIFYLHPSFLYFLEKYCATHNFASSVLLFSFFFIHFFPSLLRVRFMSCCRYRYTSQRITFFFFVAFFMFFAFNVVVTVFSPFFRACHDFSTILLFAPSHEMLLLTYLNS